MKVLPNFSLRSNNTFGIAAHAKYYANPKSVAETISVIKTPEYEKLPILILGEGSNILFTKNYEGLAIKPGYTGVSIIKESADHIWIKAGAAENWHRLVQYCIKNNWGGIENLSLIPGTVGAAPIQNIGAYGVELKDVLDTVSIIDTTTFQVESLSNAACELSYRNSIFKNRLKGKFIITNITLKLTKNKHQLYLNYGDIQKELERLKITYPDIKDVGLAVCNIRKAKLPDPKKMGNGGSFFKNPIISTKQYQNLKAIHPHIKGYEIDEHLVKIAAAWLIEQCGWKGKRIKDAGVHKEQALVLVNYGNASGKDILDLSIQIQQSVKQKFGIELIPEINIV